MVQTELRYGGRFHLYRDVEAKETFVMPFSKYVAPTNPSVTNTHLKKE